jgi:flagellar protein FliO/FliZ
MLELLARIFFSLLVVLGLMWGLAKLARRPLSRRGSSGALSVLSRQQLSRTASVAVVRVVDKALVLGITENQVSLLGEADLQAVEEQLGEPARAPAAEPPYAPRGRLHGSALSPRTWSQTVNFLKERTVRR